MATQVYSSPTLSSCSSSTTVVEGGGVELVRVMEGGKVMLLYCQVTMGRGLPTAVQVKVTLAPSPVSFTETIGVAVGKYGCVHVCMCDSMHVCACVTVCMCECVHV